MRKLIVIVCLLAWLAAPVAAAWPESCSHEAPAMAAMPESGMHEHMPAHDLSHAAESVEAPCHCDNDCAQHCDTAPSPALAALSVVEDVLRPQRHRLMVVPSFYIDPPGTDLLRPPQHQRR